MISCLSVVILCWLCTARAQMGKSPRPIVYNLGQNSERISHSVWITNAVGESEWIINSYHEATINVQYVYPTIDGNPDLDINISITASHQHFGELVTELNVFTLAPHPNTVSYLASEIKTKVTYRDIKLERINIIFNYIRVPCGKTLMKTKEKFAIPTHWSGKYRPVDCVWHIISQTANAIKIDVLPIDRPVMKERNFTILAQGSGSSMVRAIYNNTMPNTTTYHYSNDLKITMRNFNNHWALQDVEVAYESYAPGCSTHFSGIDGEIVTPSTIIGTMQCLYIIDEQTSLHKLRLTIVYPKLPCEVSYYLDVQRLDSFTTIYETNGTLTTTDHTFNATGVGIYFKIQAKSHIVVQPMHLSFKYISDTEVPTQVGLWDQLRLLNSRSATLFKEYLELIMGFIIKRVA